MTDEEKRAKRREYARKRYLKLHPDARRYDSPRMKLNVPDKCKKYAVWGECFKCPYPDCILADNNQLIKGVYPEGFKPHAQPRFNKRRYRAGEDQPADAKPSKTKMTEDDFAYVLEIFGIGD